MNVAEWFHYCLFFSLKYIFLCYRVADDMVAENSAGKVVHFTHPYFQTEGMFIGEMLCEYFDLVTLISPMKFEMLWEHSPFSSGFVCNCIFGLGIGFSTKALIFFVSITPVLLDLILPFLVERNFGFQLCTGSFLNLTYATN